MRKNIQYTFPVALFNCEKKELIGLFKSCYLAARYLFDNVHNKNKPQVNSALISKSRIRNSRFDFYVAVRACSEDHKKLLGEEDYLILNGYYVPHHTHMQGFSDTRYSLGRKDIEKSRR